MGLRFRLWPLCKQDSAHHPQCLCRAHYCLSLPGLDAHVIPQLPPSPLEGWRRSTAATWGWVSMTSSQNPIVNPCSTLWYCPLLVPF